MLKIMSLGNCNCEGWSGYAQDLSDRIVSSTATGMNIYEGPMFDFCPYCGKKLREKGAGHKKVGTWEGKSLLEFSHQELVEIIEEISEQLNLLQGDISSRLNVLEALLGAIK